MIFKRISLVNFRNYAQLDLGFSAQLNVFAGSNAQGKTNLVEAISLLSGAGAFRSSKDVDLISWNATDCRARAEIENETSSHFLEIRLSRNARKTVLINGNKVRSTSQFGEYALSVGFTPDDLQLVKGGPICRRKALDTDLAQVSATYRDLLNRYSRVVQQRNNLLRQACEGRNPAGQLEVWDEQLLDFGSRIMAKRKLAVAQLSAEARAAHSRMSGGEEALTILYRPFYQRSSSLMGSDRQFRGSMEEQSEYASEEELAVHYRSIMLRLLPGAKRIERARGVSLIGPHRDDLSYVINGIDARDFGSQGQQRTAVLAFKLAELRFIETSVREEPVMLLDDVLSELDERRRLDFISLLGTGVQAFITTTHLESLPDNVRRNSRLFVVRGGKISREG